MIVVDASIVLELLLRTPLGARLEARFFADGELANAPGLIDTEVLQVLRRLVRGKVLTAARADAAVADLQALDIVRHGHDALCRRVWELRRDLAAHDATYLALAEALDAPLLTGQRQFLRVRDRRARVELWQ